MDKTGYSSLGYVGVSEDYRGVCALRSNITGKMQYRANHTHNHRPWVSKHFDTEREAAVAYDKRLIHLGLEPVNILKRKTE